MEDFRTMNVPLSRLRNSCPLTRMPFYRMIGKWGYALWLAVICLTGPVGCRDKSEEKPTLWVYTSLYKDTIADIEPKLQQAIPEARFRFYQGGSEEVAARVNAEAISGGIKADILISSDRFWYEDLANLGMLHSYRPKRSELVPEWLRHAQGKFSAVSIPVMALVVNQDAVPADQFPKSFQELSDPKWKKKFTTGSPLASGTNFTTVAFLQKKYGWEYFKSLRANDTIAEGGNSGVLRRVQSKERPVGAVLIENVLRVMKKDPRLKIIIPDDGVVVQANCLALVNKPQHRALAEKFADWMFGPEGQAAMLRSYMYSPVDTTLAPEGAPPFAEILGHMQPWSPELIQHVLDNRQELKEEFTSIMYQ